MHLVHDATHAADFFSFRRGHAIGADASSWRKMTRKRRQWHASKNTGWLNWGGTFAHVCTFNFALAESKGYYMHATSLAVLLLLSHSCAVLAAPAASEDTGVGPPPALAPEQAPPLPLAGPLAEPRSLNQVGFPTVLTEYVISPATLRPARVALGHVWTAPAVQEESDYQRSVRVRSCIRPLSAAVWPLALM